jgi:hypothetical protein
MRQRFNTGAVRTVRAWGLGALLGLGLALAGCGGGGGGSSGSEGTAGNGASPESLSLSASELTASARIGEVGPVLSLTATVNDLGTTVYGAADPLSRNGILTAELQAGTGKTATVSVYFKSPSSLAPGTYTDTVQVSVCYDDRCQRSVKGSPATVRVSYTVLESAGSGGGGGGGGGSSGGSGITPEPNLLPLVLSAQVALPHDVVDAEFSRALNAVVMVTTYPEPQLVVRDAATGAVRQVRLPKLPKAVSVSPDGLSAAVGHDALVSHYNLADLSVPPKLLNVSADVGDIVLDGRARVHVFPATDQWVSVHSIDVATNTEQLRYGPRAGTRVRLHPNGVSIYGANNGLSPDDLEHYDISAGVGTRLRDSPYHGDYPICGNLWISEDGSTVYTACGRAFRASMDAAQDMRYAGALSLSASTTYGYRVRSLSQSAARREIALFEEPWYECTIGSGSGCVSHLNVYESDFLGRSAVYSVQPVLVSGVTYRQRGLFVFHRADGVRVVISRLDGMPNPAAEYLFGIVP